jgi:sulfonate transport system substrate-binding protein
MSARNPVQSRRHFGMQVAGLAATWAATAVWQTPASAQTAGKIPEQLRIGYQKSAVNLVILKQQGALEQRYPNTKIKWLEFPAGPQMLEALSIGSIDFGLTGDAPPVFAQAAGKDVVYVGAEPPKPRSSAVLVTNDSPLHSLQDLRGKKVALQKGSSAHFLTVRALAKAGLKWSDFTPVYLAPSDARAAFESKNVDAWAIWDPYYTATELTIHARALSTGEGLSNNNSFYLASQAFAAHYPEVVLGLFSALTQADQFVQNNRPQAIKLISDFSTLDAGVVSLFLQRRPRSPVAPLTAATVADQQAVADAFFQLGLLPKAVRVADIVWRPAAGLRPL